jgi:hypothetical protein
VLVSSSVPPKPAPIVVSSSLVVMRTPRSRLTGFDCRT